MLIMTTMMSTVIGLHVLMLCCFVGSQSALLVEKQSVQRGMVCRAEEGHTILGVLGLWAERGTGHERGGRLPLGPRSTKKWYFNELQRNGAKKWFHPAEFLEPISQQRRCWLRGRARAMPLPMLASEGVGFGWRGGNWGPHACFGGEQIQQDST